MEFCKRNKALLGEHNEHNNLSLSLKLKQVTELSVMINILLY